jgi:hypothetical protein
VPSACRRIPAVLVIVGVAVCVGVVVSVGVLVWVCSNCRCCDPCHIALTGIGMVIAVAAVWAGRGSPGKRAYKVQLFKGRIGQVGTRS